MRTLTGLCAVAALAAGNVAAAETPGAPKSTTSEVLETGAKMLQKRTPLSAASAYLNGFHFYSGDQGRQLEAHHYVTRINEDLMQGVIYDGSGEDARLIGVEYIISARLFEDLPAEEKKLWHSHDYEVKSGTLVGPGLPGPAEKALMEQIVSTYGKTWHTWHSDAGHALPLGIPALMMGFTADGQLDPQLLEARDRRLGIDSAEIRRERRDIPQPPVDPLANAWQKGEVIQLQRVLGTGEHGGAAAQEER